jgi:hypothetical protein
MLDTDRREAGPHATAHSAPIRQSPPSTRRTTPFT